MTTLAKVAKRAGVSIATVSKVLSNTPYFTEKTRQKVMQAVEELGYVPNLAARALSSGKTHIIAVIFPYVFDTIFTDPLVQHILEGVEAECSERGYHVLVKTPRISPDGPDEPYLHLLQSGYIEGIVALDNVPITSVLAPARARDIPAVAIGYQEHPFFIHSNDGQGGRLLMRHVLELGHRHIGIITIPEEMNFSIMRRIDGLRLEAEAFQIDFEAIPQYAGDFSIHSGEICVQQLLTEHPQITAIICLNDRMALGAMHQARQMGWSIPDDLTIVGYDDILGAQYSIPPLTTINQQAPQLGRVATHMLFEVLNGEEPAPVILPTELIVRESSAPPRL
jgi:DNA-binding LacI/PurR family transcriptional regulator